MTIPARQSKTAMPSSGRRDLWVYGEPRLRDLMEDPMTHLLMRRDGLTPDDVWPLVLAAQASLKDRLCRPARLAA